MIHVRRALMAVLAAPLVLLTACSGDDSGAADPVIFQTPPTPSPTKPPQRETAEHFIRRWAAEDTRMQNTGETRAFLAMSRHCEGCNSVARLVSKIYEHGGSIAWRGWRIHRVVQTLSRGHRFLDLYVYSAPTTYRPSKDAQIKHLTAGRVHYQVQVVRRGAAWLVTSFAQWAS